MLRDKHGKKMNGEDISVSTVGPDRQKGTVIKKVIDTKDGTYSFYFLPQSKGVFQLILAISGHQIQGSSFPWKVISPGQRFTTILSRHYTQQTFDHLAA